MLYIGDTFIDVQTGKNAGVKTIIVGKDIKYLGELPKYIEKIVC